MIKRRNVANVISVNESIERRFEKNRNAVTDQEVCKGGRGRVIERRSERCGGGGSEKLSALLDPPLERSNQ